MGKATIASGGTDGLYQVTLDYGQAARDARLAKINSDLAALVGKIAAAQASLDAQQAIEDAQKVVVDAAIDAYITVSNTPEAPASALENTLKNYTDAATALAKIKGDTAALRIPLDVLKSEQAQLKKDQSTWTALVLTETVSAWCADLTQGSARAHSSRRRAGGARGAEPRAGVLECRRAARLAKVETDLSRWHHNRAGR